MLKVSAYTYSNELRGAKRIYSNAAFDWDCPKCNAHISTAFNQCPLISYGTYCHVFYCEHCGYESESKMYELNSIGEDTVSITPSKLFNLKVG